MIVATIRMRTSSENRKELTQTFSSLSGPILTSKGCKSCRLYREVGNDDAIVLIEEWEQRGDWESHLESNEFSVLLGAMSLVHDPVAVEFKLLNQVSEIKTIQEIRGKEWFKTP